MTGPRWDTAIAEYSDALRARGYYTAETITALTKRIRRYAHECGHASPWHATPARIGRWLDSLAGLSPRAIYDYRIGLRTFYRWAAEAGRLPIDPTAELWGRRQELTASPAWMAALPAFLGYLRSSGCTPATVKLRRYQIIALGRTVGVADPWLTTEDDLVEWMGTRGWSRPTLKSYRAGIRTFYRWAHMVGLIERDPSAVLPSIQQRPPVPRPASEADIRAALDGADDRVRLIIRLCAEVGLRIGEAVKVRRDDLHWDTSGAWLYVTGKGQRTRRVPVGDDMARTLDEAGRRAGEQNRGHLFPGAVGTGHLSPNYAGKLVSRHLPPGVTPHKLRHRYATRTYAAHRDVFAVQQLLGHSSPATTQAYVAVPGDSLRAAAAAAII